MNKIILKLIEKVLLKEKTGCLEKVKIRNTDYIIKIIPSFKEDEWLADMYHKCREAAKNDLFLDLQQKYPNKEAQDLILEYLDEIG